MTSNSARALLLAASLVCTARPRAAELRKFEAVEPHMGTLFRIELYARDAEQARAAFRAAFDRVAELDRELSDYLPDSELNRICRTAVGRPVEASPDLLRVLEASQRLAEESGGAFDVTLGPVIRLWRQARQRRQLPDPAQLRDAAAHSGYRKLHTDPIRRTVLLDEAGMQLDLGGIAKGYAADEALAVLTRLGIRSALVAASGDLAFSDAPPGRRGWTIGIDSADRPAAPFARTIELANAAVSTSGDEEQHAEIGGKRYSHIVDPATGMGLTDAITVTIVARRGIDADALATAVSVLGADRGSALLEKRGGVSGLIVTDRGVRAVGSAFNR